LLRPPVLWLLKNPFFSITGCNLVDSSSIFKDGQFEDVSEVRKAYCWNYFLFNGTNHKAKCRVKTNEGEYCDRILSVPCGNTTSLRGHLKNRHEINSLPYI